MPAVSAARRRTGPPVATGHGQEGQATVEYSALLAVLAVVLAVAGAQVVSGGAIFNSVLRGWELALCKVTGSRCEILALKPCTVYSGKTAARVGVKLAVVTLGGGVSVLREQLSDGTVRVSLVDTADLGAEGGAGAEAKVSLGTKTFGGGAWAGGGGAVTLGRRRVWDGLDGPRADRLISQIRQHVAAEVGARAVPLGGVLLELAHTAGYRGDRLPEPDAEAVDAGASAARTFKLGGGDGEAGFAASIGGTRKRDGSIRLSFGVQAQLTAEVTRAFAGAGLDVAGNVSVAAAYDPAGRPTDLYVTVAGSGKASETLRSPRHRGTPGQATGASLAAQLDLADAENRRAYDRLLAALDPRRAAQLPAAGAALAERLRAAGRFDVERYATTDRAYGAEGQVGAGVKGGADLGISTTSRELIDAWTRPAGGVWEQRTDCLTARA